MRYGVKENGRIVNVIEASPAFAKEIGAFPISDEVDIGWEVDKDDSPITPPLVVSAPVIPEYISRRQFMLMVEMQGLSNRVAAWIQGQGKLTKIAYENSGSFHRNDPTLIEGFKAIDLTDAQVDTMFINAANI